MPKLDLATVPVKTGSIYPAPYAAMMAGRSSLRLGEAGGLTQYGVNLITLDPGAMSSLRHWHAQEDELVLVTEGICTMVTDAGAEDMHPGDCAVFPAGNPDGHHFLNRTDQPARFIVIGTKAARETATYSDVDLIVTIDGRTATFTRKDGTPYTPTDTPPRLPVAKPATQPAKLTPPAWATDNPTHPILGPGPGEYRYQLLSDPGGLTQFGAFLEELPPGSRSGHRHWHENEDEMVILLSGDLILVEDSETPMTAGDVAAWPAGHPIGHRLDNRSDQPARYLVIGTRRAQDRIHYTDHDLITEKDGPARRYLHRDGTPYGDAK